MKKKKTKRKIHIQSQRKEQIQGERERKHREEKHHQCRRDLDNYNMMIQLQNTVRILLGFLFFFSFEEEKKNKIKKKRRKKIEDWWRKKNFAEDVDKVFEVKMHRKNIG